MWPQRVKYVSTDIGLAWGFLASHEVKQADIGNLGLRDRKHTDFIMHYLVP